MNKNILLGIAAFGGLILVGVMLKDTPEPISEGTYQEVDEVATITLPDTMPVQIPVHPYVAVQTVRESENEGTDYISFSVAAEATKREVNDWYRDALSQNGWNIISDKNVAGYQIIQGENENLYTSMQAAGGDGGTVVISQQVQIRPSD
tara:strand:- start:72 stop:518 length:447 start_codon:yes stop_codon:yes gene_type:complete